MQAAEQSDELVDQEVAPVKPSIQVCLEGNPLCCKNLDSIAQPLSKSTQQDSC